MLKVAKIAVFILAAMAPVAAVAQRSQGRLDRKPSPSSSAASTPAAQSGTQSTGTKQFVTSDSFFHPNSKNNPTPGSTPAISQTVVRPAPAIQTDLLPSPVVPVASEPPPVPATAQPVPSSEPSVTVHYAQGQLTVLSQNSSLGSVLKLISAKTGAVIDLSPELQSEPVMAQIGPSAVREVLTALLDSPRIDYIIMGAGDAGGGVERIVVRTRQSFARTAMSTSQPQRPGPQEADTEAKLDENGKPATAVATPKAPLTQEQLMDNWRKIREEKRLAEIEQQRQDRENERNHVEVEPAPQPEPQPVNPPTENPPPQ